MTALTFTYLAIAALCLGISLATTSRPRSVPLIALAAMVWPITLAAITAQAFVVSVAAKAMTSGARPCRQCASRQ